MTDLLDHLRGADPLLRNPVDASDERLGRVRRIVEARRSTPLPHLADSSRPRLGSRRWFVLAGAATAVAAVGTAVLSLPSPEVGPSLAVASVALDEDGSLRCLPLDGFSEPIDPIDAPVRLLPAWIPEGWRVGQVWADEEISASCYLHPSLTMADLDPDGRVDRSAMVYGPIVESIDFAETLDTSPTTIAGLPGELIVRGSPKGPGELLWVWRDESGRHWLMRSYGYDRTDGQSLADALRLDGTQVSLVGDAPDDTIVLHERTGQPFPGRTPTHHWFFTLGTGPMEDYDGEVTVEVISSAPGTLGVDGVFPDGMYVQGSGDTLRIHQDANGTQRFIVRQGTAVALLPNLVTGGEPTLGSMTPAQWVRLVESLTPVSVDDPRLRELALDR
jgi:hypothetical protein